MGADEAVVDDRLCYRNCHESLFFVVNEPDVYCRLLCLKVVMFL